MHQSELDDTYRVVHVEMAHRVENHLLVVEDSPWPASEEFGILGLTELEDDSTLLATINHFGAETLRIVIISREVVSKNSLSANPLGELHVFVRIQVQDHFHFVAVHVGHLGHHESMQIGLQLTDRLPTHSRRALHRHRSRTDLDLKS